MRIPAAVDAEIDALVPAMHDLVARAADEYAYTLSGMKSKAAMLLSYSEYEMDGVTPSFTNHDELLSWSIARDLLGDAAAQADAEPEVVA